MRACPAGLPVKAHAPALASGFQHPASAVAPSGHRSDETRLSRTRFLTDEGKPRVTYMHPVEPNRPAAGEWQIKTHGSGLVEQVLEYRFLADLTAELLRRGMRFEILR